jgi:hypothetical protein
LPTLELVAWVKIVRKASPITPQFSSGVLDRRLDLRKLANKEKRGEQKGERLAFIERYLFS